MDKSKELYQQLEQNAKPIVDELSLSAGQVKDFEEGLVWQALKRVMIARIVALRDKLELTGEGFRPEAFVHIQAELYTLRILLDLPSLLKDNLEETEEETSERSKD